MKDYEHEPTPEAWRPNAPESKPTRLQDLAKNRPGCGRPNDRGQVIGPLDGGPNGFAFDPEPRSPDRDDSATGVAPRFPLAEGVPGPTFSEARFADEVRARLSGNCTGWAFVINRNGQEAAADSGGTAITPGDLGSGGNVIGTRDFTPDTRINVASVSKVITAVAIMRLLEATGRGINSLMWRFLPSGWAFGTNVRDLRFRHLLTHQSGLTSSNNNFSQTLTDQGLQTALALGANPGAAENYLNVNFALFRVILPALWREAGQPAANNDDAVASAFFYAVYIIEEIFGRMGGAVGENASTSPLDAIPTRYYSNASAFQGMDYPNWALWAGGGGWHMSARELAAFLAFTSYDDAVLSPAARTIMDGFRLGWRSAGTYAGSFGDYLGHGGSIDWTVGGVTGRTRTGIMKFNLQVEAAFVANSAIAGYTTGSVANLLRDAYDAAWS